MNRIRAIVFDAYGTLLDLSSIDRRMQAHFGDQALAIARTWRQKQLEYTWLRDLMTRYQPFSQITREALRYASRHHDAMATDEILDDLMQHYYKLEVFPEVPRVMEELSRHYELAILSNADGDLLRQAVMHNRLDPYLKGIFSIDAIRRYKPAPQVYQLPQAGLGLEKSSLLFVSSNTWDTAGAKSYGLQVAWLRRQAGQEEALGFPADLQVSDLEDLRQRLAELIL